MLKSWSKHDKDSAYHVLYRLTGMSPSDKVPCLEKESLRRHLQGCMAKYNESPHKLGLSNQPLDWEDKGWFEFVEASAGSSSVPHCKMVKCAGFLATAPLPAHIKAGSKMRIEKNYALRSATLVVSDDAREHSLLIFDLFSLIDGFCDFASMEVEGARAAKAAVAPVDKATGAPAIKVAGAPAADVDSAAGARCSPSKMTPKAWAVSDKLKSKLAALKNK